MPEASLSLEITPAKRKTQEDSDEEYVLPKRTRRSTRRKTPAKKRAATVKTRRKKEPAPEDTELLPHGKEETEVRKSGPLQSRPAGQLFLNRTILQ